MISVFGSKVGPEELEEVRGSLEAQWMGIGPKTKAFEAAFSKRLGLTDLALLDSGSNSLYLAIKLLKLPPGSEIIVPSFTWIACAHAVVLAGCVPVFCDVELETQNCSARTIEPCLSEKTGAIMVVHYAGKPVEMDAVLRLGKPVIEDAAHAVDSYLDGKACGAMGAVGIYSFDAVKNLAMGEGGGVTAQSAELVAQARLLRYCGIGKSGFQASADKDRWWEYHIVDFMPKFLPSDVHAAIGLAQLRKLDGLQAYRKQIWELFQRELAGVSWLARPVDPGPREKHSYFTYFVRVLNGKRDKLAKYLYDQGIYTTLRYHPLHMNPIYKSSARLPSSERLNEEGLNLPLHPNLSETDLEKILSAVKGFRG
ncbi:MAG TPA: DegT/DnrJ/EryC1/StrS family aminotransferase [Polyangia bacterium]|nr:DegT/DnrJ/EryC1/StrS family aminotransferase [Polyangia bacterium]